MFTYPVYYNYIYHIVPLPASLALPAGMVPEPLQIMPPGVPALVLLCLRCPAFIPCPENTTQAPRREYPFKAPNSPVDAQSIAK